MVIQIEPNCECQCQKEQNINTGNSFACNDPLCNYHGKLVCGACECCDNFFGPYCNCTNRFDPEKGCRKPYTVVKEDKLTAIRYQKDDCSGKGECDGCGKCVCHQERECVVISGPYCDQV